MKTLRFGFTLVELLVSIAIIGALVGLLLPAVQMVRAAAQKSSCQNKMRQLGISLHNFESANGELPSGIVGLDDPRFPSMSWLTRTLPFIDQTAIWNIALDNFQSNPRDFTAHSGLATPVSMFYCPSAERDSGPHNTHLGIRAASTYYIGVNGTNFTGKDGIFYLDSRTRFSEISDGLSNTLMIGERPPSPDYWYGWWYAGAGRRGTGSPDMNLGVAELNELGAGGLRTYLEDCGEGPFSFQPGSTKQACSTLHFWSHHSGGANFVAADGSVKFYSFAITDDVLIALSTRNGGEPTGEQ